MTETLVRESVLTETPEVRTRTRRMTPRRVVRHTGALTWRVLTSVRHNPEPLFLLGAQPVLFLVLTVYIYGGQMAGSTHEYLQYVVPGIMGYNAIFATMSSAPVMFTDLQRGIFDRFRSLPVSRLAPLFARIIGDFVLQLWALVLFMAISFALGFRVQTHWWDVAFSVLLLAGFALGMSWLGMAIGLSVKSAQSVQMLSYLCTIPLSFISGAFAQTATMPGWLQAVVKLNPVTWLSAAERGLLVGGPILRPVCYTLLSVAVIAVVFAPVALRGLRRRG